MVKYYKIKKSSNPKKETAWKNFSKYIRIRDAIKTTGTPDYAQCITCGNVFTIEDMDAGHGLAGRANSILFNEEIVNAQCRWCNRGNGGELQAYKMILLERYGQDKWDMWESMKRKHIDFSQFDYEQISRVYRLKTKELLK